MPTKRLPKLAADEKPQESPRKQTMIKKKKQKPSGKLSSGSEEALFDDLDDVHVAVVRQLK